MAKKNKKCTSKECKRFERSQRAHLNAVEYWGSKQNSAKKRVHFSYHAAVLQSQRDRGDVLSKAERKKIFTGLWNHERAYR